MTTNSLERKTFMKYKKLLVSELGTKALDDETLNKVGRKEFAAWGGVWPIDRGTLKPFHYYIYNTDPHDKPGDHWVGVYCTGGRVYIYDSYGREPSSIVYRLLKTIKKHGFKLGRTDLVPHKEQIGYTSELCGVNSMAFLLTVRDLGIARARRI